MGSTRKKKSYHDRCVKNICSCGWLVQHTERLTFGNDFCMVLCIYCKLSTENVSRGLFDCWCYFFFHLKNCVLDIHDIWDSTVLIRYFLKTMLLEYLHTLSAFVLNNIWNVISWFAECSQCNLQIVWGHPRNQFRKFW